MIDKLRELHSRYFGEVVEDSVQLKGDGSARKIFRLRGANHSSIGIHGENVDENRAFVGFSRTFRSHGLRVPEIFDIDKDERFYLEEDLGDETFFDWMHRIRLQEGFSESIIGMYRAALHELCRIQIDAGKHIDYALCYQHGAFARESMYFDLRYFRDMFLRNFYHDEFSDTRYEADCESLTKHLLETPRDYFLYRDFQSRNIMVKNGELYFIDYQSGRKGALPYDVASLLHDARADIPFPVRERLLSLYIEEARQHCDLDVELFRKYYAGFSLIRIVQALGAFGNLGFLQGKKHFLQSIPYAMKNLEWLIEEKTMLHRLPYFSQLFETLVADTSLRHLA